jgi:hypothetical protein
MDVGGQVEAHKFPYPFYFSRVLDVNLEKQKQIDQRSIRFDTRDGQMVLEITGKNCFCAFRFLFRSAMPAKKKSSGPASTLANRVATTVEKRNADPSRKGNDPWPENGLPDRRQPCAIASSGMGRWRSGN